MDQRPKCKNPNHKTSREKHKRKSLWPKNFLGHTKAQITKAIN